MAFDYINEAFKKLALLEESVFNNSVNGINQLSTFMDADDDTIRVIDPEAETDEELKDSYIGKIIINCNICHSHIFENKEDLIIDEEGNVNPETPCPYCGEQEGFTIVGEIAPFNAETATEEPAEDDSDVEPVETESEEVVLEEGLFDFGKRKKEVAARNQANSANRSAKYKEAQEKALANTTVVVKMYRDHSQNPKIEDYYDLAQNADLQVRKLTNMERDKNIVYNAMSAKAAQKYGAVVSLPQRFLDKYLKEGLGAAIGLGLAAGAARAVGDKVTSSILGDDLDTNEEDELLTEEPKMSRASRRSLKENTADIDTLIDSVGGIDNVRDILETTANEHPGVEADSEELSNVSYNFVEDSLTYSEWESVVEYVYESVFGNTALTEDFKEVSIKTDDQKLEMTSDENGKVTVTTEPIESAEQPVEEETIAPLSAETQEEIMTNNEVSDEGEENSEENASDEEEFDFDFEDIDEEGMDELGESYLRKIYENVRSFKTSSVGATETSLIVEGVITFDSGAKKKTGFIFEAKDANKKGQVRFVGSNKQLSEAANAFTLVGKVDNKKLFVESLKYNYTVNNNTVRGVVRRK